MVREIKTIRDAAQEWVREMDAIPQGMIAKLMAADPDDWHEVTVPSVGDRVYVYGKDSGEITGVENVDEGTVYTVELDSGDITACQEDDFELEFDDILPMWGTMWSFHDSADIDWLEGGYGIWEENEGIKALSRCGFRVYESEEFGYFFGIDGAGYDFYSDHWCRLYKARGLKWHNTEEAD